MLQIKTDRHVLLFIQQIYVNKTVDLYTVSYENIIP